MPINFPNSPSPSQLYSYDNKTWEWNGTYWEVYSALTSYVTGSGTTNYVPVWTGSTTLGNSIIQSNGSEIGVGISPDPSYLAWFYTTGTTGLFSNATTYGIIGNADSGGIGIQGNASGGGYGVQGIISTGGGGWGVYGESYNGIGVHGKSYGDTGPNIGVRGETNIDSGGTPENIGGYFSAINGGTNYSVQLTDGTEGTNKVLVSQTSDGKANWSGELNITGVTATTISATTYLNLPYIGTTNYIPKWTNTTGLTDSQLVDDGSQVYIGLSPSHGGTIFNANGGVEVGGAVQVIGSASSIGITDTDLSTWTSGGGEIAIGTGSPLAISTGSDNIAIGGASQSQNDTGIRNVSVGSGTLTSNQAGQQNTAIGHKAGFLVTSGSYNVLIGHGAGYNLETGGSNVFLGNDAGFNETGSNKLYIANSGGTPLIYGEFDNGIVNINGTLSATTYDNLPGSSSANCFSTFYVTNISGCSPVNVLSPLNVKDGLSVTGTSTFTSQVNFTAGISASTLSATTYENLPVSAVTSGTGISASTSNGVVTVSNTQVQGITGKTDGTGISSSISNNVITITNSDLGSSQNIFKNIQVDGVTQFSAGSNSSNLNFSGVNITITSAATNTLIFSADTGGGGGVTSLTAGSGLSGSSTTGAVTLVNTQVQGITGITAGAGITVSTTNNVSTITNGIGVAVMTSNVENQTTTLINLPELTFSVLNGSTYRFRFVIHYEAFNTSTGSRFTLSGAATTFLSYRSMYSLGAGTQTLNPALSAYDQPAASNTSSTATAGNIAIVEGILKPSADGSVVGRFASEAPIAGAFIRAMAGSYVEYQKIA